MWMHICTTSGQSMAIRLSSSLTITRKVNLLAQASEALGLRALCIRVYGCPAANAPGSSTQTAVRTPHKDGTSTIIGTAPGSTFSGMPGPGKCTGSSDLISPIGA